MVRTILRLIAAVALACLCQGCNRSPQSDAPSTLRVLAAASLTDAFKELGTAFERTEPGVKIEFSFGGSNQLRLQLEQGSPGDVFVSADRTQMDAAVASGVVRAESASAFTSNELVILVPRKNPASISSLADLGLRPMKVLVADKAVPVGRLAQRLIEQATKEAAYGEAFATRLEAVIVSREQNAAALTTKVALGEADAALAYANEAFGHHAADLTCLPLPEHLRQRTEYAAAVTSHASSSSRAERFVAFLRTPEAQAVLASRGFAAAETRRP